MLEIRPELESSPPFSRQTTSRIDCIDGIRLGALRCLCLLVYLELAYEEEHVGIIPWTLYFGRSTMRLCARLGTSQFMNCYQAHFPVHGLTNYEHSCRRQLKTRQCHFYPLFDSSHEVSRTRPVISNHQSSLL